MRIINDAEFNYSEVTAPLKYDDTLKGRQQDGGSQRQFASESNSVRRIQRVLRLMQVSNRQ